MLINKYLPTYQFSEYHSIEVKGTSESIYKRLLKTNFRNNNLINLLLRLRGISKELYAIEHLTQMGFIKLAEEQGREVVYGMITSSSAFQACQSQFSDSDFLITDDSNLIKAVINFRVQDKNNLYQTISTETRIWCGSEVKKRKFKYYWFFVKPFSKLLRRAVLKEIKRQTEICE